MENLSLEAVTRELNELLQARREAPWTRHDAARYKELTQLELEFAKERRSRLSEAGSRLAEIAALRQAELDLNIERMREEMEAREGFSALRQSPATRELLLQPASQRQTRRPQSRRATPTGSIDFSSSFTKSP